jgi:glutamate carboxypeptidase
MQDWIARHAAAIAARAERELEALVAVSSPSGDVRGAEEAAALAAALAPGEATVERPPCSSPTTRPISCCA